jgi:hypothetical protein
MYLWYMFLDDVEYLVEEFCTNGLNEVKHVQLHYMESWSSYAILPNAPIAYSLIQMHRIGSQEEVQVAVQEEQAGADPQEIQAHEVPEV